MFGKQEFGVEYYAKVTDVGTPWDDSLLEADWERGGRAAWHIVLSVLQGNHDFAHHCYYSSLYLEYHVIPLRTKLYHNE